MADTEDIPDDVAELPPTLLVDPEDPELERARAAIEARLLGIPLEPARIGRFVVLGRLGAGGMGVVYAGYDPRLDRRVAIKLLTTRDESRPERDRLVAEAIAMARLAHPNVVHVYEVGEHRGQLFVAMEHVHGRTLRRWCAETSPAVADVLAVCRQAGEGLAAANAAGIVHRDFKPENVIVGDDRGGPRARVLDFGLARTLAERTHSDVGDAPATASAQTTSGTGARAGTPGYIAPELLRGDPASACSDQFSFCITAWEALTGALPFPAGDTAAYLAAIAAKRIDIPANTRMPTWVERVLRRGLADDPHAADHGRWPSLDDLLRALARDPATLRRRRIGVAAVVTGMVGAFAVGGALRSRVDEPCAGGVEEMAVAWPGDARAAALARIDELGPYGASVATRLSAHADEFVSAWVRGHREACIAHQRGEQSAELLDRRMACLHRSLSGFAAFGRVVERAEPEQLSRLVATENALLQPSACADLDALGAIIEPPPANAREFVERFTDIQVRVQATDYDGAIADAAALVEDARRAGYRPHLAQALELHASIAIDRGTDRAAIGRELLEATDIGLTVGDERLALRSWAIGAWAVATGQDSAGDVRFEGARQMTALAERYAGDPVAIQFFTRLGGIALANGRLADARAAYGRALELGEPTEARGLAQAFEGLALATEDPRARDELFAEAVRARERDFGPDHPRTLDQRAMAAANHSDDHTSLELLDRACANRRELHPTRRLDQAQCERQISLLAELEGDAARTRAASERWAAVAIDDIALANATVALLAGDPTAAVATIEPKVREGERARSDAWPFYMWLEHGENELLLGRALRELGDPRATATLTRALADIERGADGMTQPVVRRKLAHARLIVGATR